MWGKTLFISTDKQKSKLLNSLRHPINKVGSISSFRSEDISPSVSLSKKIETFY